MANLVTELKAAGVPIDGIGIESHLIVGEVPTTMKTNMEQFTALGVEVAITELDIRMTLPETAALLAQQKTDYNTVISACMAVSGCVGMTVWDYTDKVGGIKFDIHDEGRCLYWSLIVVLVGSCNLLWTRCCVPVRCCTLLVSFVMLCYMAHSCYATAELDKETRLRRHRRSNYGVVAEQFFVSFIL